MSLDRSVRKKYLWLGICFGSLFSFSFVIGKSIQEEWWSYTRGIQTFFRFGRYFLITETVFVPLFILLYFLCIWITGRKKKKFSGRELGFLPMYMIMLLPYLICFLVYFPGSMSYDSWYITLQALGLIGFDNHHPFLHTLIWSIFAHMDEWLGIEQIGIILYTAVQLIIMTAIYTYVSIWLGRRLEGLGRWIVFLYYIGNPVFHIFTLLLTKDVYFSGCFLLLSIAVTEYLEKELSGNDDKACQRKVMILGLLCCLLRNNMIYVMVVFGVVLFFVFKKNVKQCRGIILAAGLFFFISNIIYPSMGVAKGSVKEMLSVPLSQIAAVYHKDMNKLEESDKELIKKYIPDVENYNRFFADPIKGNFNDRAFEEDKGEFLHLWWNLFKDYPAEYVKAFLSLNLPYWYPPMDSVREYIETDNYSQDYPVERLNLLPSLYNYYEEVSENQAAFMHLPVFRQLYAIGVPIWIFLFFLFWFAANKRKEVILAIMPCILLWMTYLLGPVSSFRYVEPLLLTYPVWFTLGLERKI